MKTFAKPSQKKLDEAFLNLLKELGFITTSANITTITYSADGGDEPDFTRLLEEGRDDFYQTIKTLDSNNYQELILNIPYIDSYHLYRVITVCEILLQAGFKISALQDEKIIPITDTEFLSQNFHKFSYTDEASILKKVIHKEKNNIGFLNCFSLNKLIKHIYDQPNDLFHNHFAIKSITLAELCSLYEQDPRHEKFNEFVNYLRNHEFILEFPDYFTKYYPQSKMDEASLKNILQELNNQLKNNIIGFTNYNINKHPKLSSYQFPKLKFLQIESNDSSDQTNLTINEILSNFPSLEYFYFVNIFMDEKIFNGINLSAAKEIILNNCYEKDNDDNAPDENEETEQDNNQQNQKEDWTKALEKFKFIHMISPKFDISKIIKNYHDRVKSIEISKDQYISYLDKNVFSFPYLENFAIDLSYKMECYAAYPEDYKQGKKVYYSLFQGKSSVLKEHPKIAENIAAKDERMILVLNSCKKILEHLTVDLSSDYNLESLTSITLPNLKTITFKNSTISDVLRLTTTLWNKASVVTFNTRFLFKDFNSLDYQNVRFPNIQTLIIDDAENYTFNDLLEFLKFFPNLQFLKLYRNTITVDHQRFNSQNFSSTGLKVFEQLKFLELYYCKLNDITKGKSPVVWIDIIHLAKKVEELNLKDIKDSPDNVLPLTKFIVKDLQLPFLKTILLLKCELISEHVFKDLATSSPKLRNIFLDSCTLSTTKTNENISFPNQIESIYLNETNVNADIILNLPKQCTKLQSMTLGRSRKITVLTVDQLRKNFPNVVIKFNKNLAEKNSFDNESDESTGLDRNTLDKNYKVKARKYFTDIAVEKYRLDARTEIRLEGNKINFNADFDFFDEKEIIEIPATTYVSDNFILAQKVKDYEEIQKNKDLENQTAVIPLFKHIPLHKPLEKYKWTPLPSVSAYEEIAKDDIICSAPIKLRRKQGKSLYEVKLSEECAEDNMDVIIEYIVKIFPQPILPRLSPELLKTYQPIFVILNNAKIVSNRYGELRAVIPLQPSNKISEEEKSIPLKEAVKLANNNEKIDDFTFSQILQEYFLSFDSGDTEITAEMDDAEVLNIMNEAKIGKCDQRSTLWKIMSDSYGIKTRMDDNDVHTNIEVFLDHPSEKQKIWYRGDGGGYAAKVEIEENDFSPAAVVDIIKNKPSKEKSNDNLPTASTSRNPIFQKLIPVHAENFNELITFITKQLATESKKQTVVIVDDIKQIENFHYCLLEHLSSLKEKRPNYFYVANPEYITLKKNEIKTNNITPVDSPFLYFVQSATADDYLAVNFSCYNTGHIAFQSLFDDKRHFNGNSFNKNTLAFALITQNQLTELSQDFKTRFNILFSVHGPALEKNPLEEYLKNNSDLQMDGYPIELYEDPKWRDRLAGQLQLANKLDFAYGEIFKIIGKTEPCKVNLRNAPMHLEEFRLYLAEMIFKKQFFINSKYHKIPESLHITLNTTPFFPTDNYSIINTTIENFPAWDLPLNQRTFNYFFKMYNYDNYYPKTTPGWLELNKSKTITLAVTGELTLSQYQLLLDSAKEYKVFLQLLDFGIGLIPYDLKMTATPTPITFKTTEQIPPSPFQPRVIVTNDIQCAYIEVTQQEKLTKENCFTFDVTSSSYMSLVELPIPDKDAIFPFKYQRGILATAMKDYKFVILKGDFSLIAEKLQNLFSQQPHLFINGKQEFIQCQIIIITDNEAQFFLAKNYQVKNYNKEHYINILSSLDKDQRFLDKDQRLDQLLTIINEFFPNDEFSFQELQNLLEHFDPKNPAKTFKLQLAHNDKHLLTIAAIKKKYPNSSKNEKSTLATIEKNLHKIAKILHHGISITLIGKTGTGKTTLVRDYLPEFMLKNFGIVVKIFGLEHLGKWLEKPEAENVHHYLFIDEFNLLDQARLNPLKNIYSDAPGYPSKAQFQLLGPNQKVIVAGNPRNADYQNRQKTIFEEFGNIQIIEDLSDEDIFKYIITQMLKIIFANRLNPETMTDIAKDLRDIYDALKSNPYNIKLSIRRLGAIVIHFGTLAIDSTTSTEQLNKFISECVYTEIKNSLTKEQKDEFKKSFGIKDFHKNIKKELITHNVANLAKFGFKATKPYHSAIIALDAFVARRELKIKHPELLKQGRNAVILEGEASTGKTTLAVNFLLTHGFKQITDINDPTIQPNTNVFFHATGINLGEFLKILAICTRNGWVAVVDEWNILPIEYFSNFYLSGRDMNDQNVNNGFGLVLTQNPPDNYILRKYLTKAAEDRVKLIEIILDKGTILEIAIKKLEEQGFADLSKETAEPYVERFLQEVTTEKTLTPALRNLISVLETLNPENKSLLLSS